MFKNISKLFLRESKSKNTAKNRLQMVLVQDRSGLSPQDMDGFKEDLVGVISKYFVVDKAKCDVEWQRQDNATALIINMPVIGKPKEVKKEAAAG